MVNYAVKTEGCAPVLEPRNGALPSGRLTASFRGSQILCSLFLYALTLFYGLQGVISSGPMPDELHWTNRSGLVIKRVDEGSLVHLTSHLPHPGIPGSIAMALGQTGAKIWNEQTAQIPGSNRYLDPLAGSRIGATLVAAFFPVLVFLLLTPLFGVAPALITSALFALDPYFLSISNQAHIDATLSICIAGSAFAFILAAERAACRSAVSYQVLATVFWGFAMASKPTAILLLPAFAGIRLIYRFSGLSPRLIWLRDIWSVVGGLVVFGCVYTRIWHRWVRHQFELNVWKEKDMWADTLAAALAPYSLLIFGACVSVLAATLWYERRNSGKILLVRLSLHLTLILGLFGTVLLLNPTIIRNFVGYFHWVLGLSNTGHYAYGRNWEPPAYGYWGLIAAKLPDTILIGLLFSLVALTGYALRSKISKQIVARCLSLLVFFGAIVGGLSISDKQGYRYLLPILPVLYALCVYGIYQFLSHRSWPLKVSFGIVSLALFITQKVEFVRWGEALPMYSNRLSGGLAEGIASGAANAFVYQSQIVDELQKIAERENREISVGVLGDYQTLKYSYARRYPRQSAKGKARLKIANWFGHAPGEYSVIYPAVLGRLGKNIGELAKHQTIFSKELHGQTVVGVYRPVPPTADVPLNFNLRDVPRRTGKVVKDKDGKESIAGIPGEHSNNYLFYDVGIYAPPGEYEVTFTTIAQEIPKELTDERYAYRAELGKRCQRVITVGELRTSPSEQKLSCSFDREVYIQVRAYWFGLAPVHLRNVSIRRLPSSIAAGF